MKSKHQKAEIESYMELAKSFGLKILDWKVLNVDKTQNRAMVKVRENSIAMGEENTQINTYQLVYVKGRWLFNEWPFEEETEVGEGSTGEKGEEQPQPGWETHTENLVSEVTNVSTGSDYFPFGASHYWFAEKDDVKDITITGTVRALFENRFNFYVFDKHNYELWDVGASYKTMENVENVSSYNFTIHPTYNQVEDGVRLVVSNAIPQETTEDSVYSDTHILYEWEDNSYDLGFMPYVGTEVPAIQVSGNASEIKNRAFNFLIMNEENFHRWRSGLSYESYYEDSGSSSYTFSYTISSEEAEKDPYFVVDRAGESGKLKVETSATASWKVPPELTMEISAQLEWKEKI